MEQIKVAIVDDHKIFREGLKVLLKCMNNIDIVIEASTGKEFLDQLESVEPHLAIIDINMPIMGGDDAARRALEKYPKLKIIVLSMSKDEQFFKIMNDIGVAGYIVKESDYEELERAIQTVLKGGKYFSQELLLSMVTNRTSSGIILNLSERERDVLLYLCKGYSASEIAEKLFLSPRTIEKYRSNLLALTQSSNSISLVVFAIKNGLVRL